MAFGITASAISKGTSQFFWRREEVRKLALYFRNLSSSTFSRDDWFNTSAHPDRRGPSAEFSGKLHVVDASGRRPAGRRRGELVVAFFPQRRVRGFIASTCLGALVHLVVQHTEAANRAPRQGYGSVSTIKKKKKSLLFFFSHQGYGRGVTCFLCEDSF